MIINKGSTTNTTITTVLRKPRPRFRYLDVTHDMKYASKYASLRRRRNMTEGTDPMRMVPISGSALRGNINQCY